VATGEELQIFKGHQGSVDKVVFSPDGQLLASGDNKGVIKIWSVATAQELKSLQVTDPPITQLAFSPDGKTLFSVNVSDTPINSWSVDGWQQKAGFKINGQFYNTYQLFFDQAGQAFDFSKKDTNFDIYNIATGAKVNSFTIKKTVSNTNKPFSIYAEEINPTTRVVITTSSEGKTQWWSLDDGRELPNLEVGDGIVQPLLNGDGSKALLTSQDHKSISLWSLGEHRELITTFNSQFGDFPKNPDKYSIGNIIWSPDGKILLSMNVPNELKGWSLETGKQLWDIPLKQYSVNAVAFSPNSKIVATATDEGTIVLRSVPSGKQLSSFKGHISSINTLAFSPDGQNLAGAGSDNSIEIWSTSTSQPLKRFTLEAAESVFSLAYSPDGQSLAILSNDITGGGKSLELLSVATGKVIRKIEGATDYRIESVAFRFDGKAIAVAGDGSCGSDLLLAVYDPPTDEDSSLPPISGISSLTAVTFSPDGKMLIVGNGRELQVWSADKPTLLRDLSGHDDAITYTAFSAEGKTLVSASNDSTVKVWNWPQGRELFSTTALQTPQLNATALAPNGKYIATGQQDGSFKLWEIPTKS
jgi:WD40 repeat protein